jgi:Mce-associated membrane protein
MPAGTNLTSASTRERRHMATHPNTTEGRSESVSTVGDDDQADDAGAGGGPTTNTKTRALPRRTGLAVKIAGGCLIVAALAGVSGWQAYHAYHARAAHQQRDLFLRVASQGAVYLTTIRYIEVDTDVQRILDSSTGTFHDDFQTRAQPFVEIVRKAQSTSQGTVTAAALASGTGDQASALVAVSVKTSTSAAPQHERRAWRMRITVQKVGDTAKVSDVQFVR